MQVEVDQHRLAEARLDEAVGVAVKFFQQGLPRNKELDVFGQHIRLEVGNRSRLGTRKIGGVADHKNILVCLRLQAVLVGGNKA